MIDLTLNSLLVPDILGYAPPFGQKVTTTPENKGGLSTQQVNDNILLPFATQRAVEVTTTDTTSKVERDARLVITGDNVTLTISGDSFAGCKLSILATKPATVVINGTPFTMAQGSGQDVIYTGDKWIGLYPTIGEIFVQYPHQMAPSELFMATEWTNTSSMYAGCFFRAEGGDAEGFGMKQQEGLPNITGSAQSQFSNVVGSQFNNTYNIVDGCFFREPRIGVSATGVQDGGNIPINALTFNAARSNPIYGASTHVTPINTTIRVWKRTA